MFEHKDDLSKSVPEKLVGIKVFDEREMVDKEYNERELTEVYPSDG